uniref:Anaphase-promoting complex subunit cdh1-like n=1 Tax=Dermatophagoides pteronyssinus TaxID=6956 RepID=A0A6P6YK46_DERPT|nr:anaphase-promoting complex subunit cdh1-like [Dermatophagoides pteronyssinus]
MLLITLTIATRLISPIQMVLCDQFQSSQSSPPQSLPLTSINFRCPEQFGYYADEYNCSKYFVCVFGEALHESCTGGLRFSSELQTCDWPRNVICPYEDSDYDETEDDFVDSGSYSLSNNNNNKQQQQVGSGMIIETKNPTTTTTSTTTAKPLSSSNSDFYDNHHPFILLNHKSQPSSFTKSLLPPSSTNATTTIQQQQTPTHQISAKTSPSTNGLFSIRNNLSVNNNNQYTTPTSHHNHNHNHQNDNSRYYTG